MSSHARLDVMLCSSGVNLQEYVPASLNRVLIETDMGYCQARPEQVRAFEYMRTNKTRDTWLNPLFSRFNTLKRGVYTTSDFRDFGGGYMYKLGVEVFEDELAVDAPKQWFIENESGVKRRFLFVPMFTFG